MNKLIRLCKLEERRAAKTLCCALFARSISPSWGSYVKRLGEATRESDREQIERQFKANMTGDLTDLRRELKEKSVNLIISKELLEAAAVGVGAIVEPVTTSIISSALLAIAKALRNHRGKKRTIYRGDGMSLLYMLDPSKVYG